MEHCHPHDTAHKVEVRQVLLDQEDTCDLNKWFTRGTCSCVAVALKDIQPPYSLWQQKPSLLSAALHMTHRVDCRVRVNLESVDVITGVLEQAIVRVQHLMWKQIEPLPGQRSNKDKKKLTKIVHRELLHICRSAFSNDPLRRGVLLLLF